MGPDGRLCFGQGTATNSAVVGQDSARFGWLSRAPQFHDVPGTDVVLTGENLETDDPLDGGSATTGAFLPFDSPSQPRQAAVPSLEPIRRLAYAAPWARPGC